MADSIVEILNKVASKNSLKIDFDDVTLGAGPLQARVNGGLAIDVELAKE